MLIDPRSDEEIRADVFDFAEHLSGVPQALEAEQDTNDWQGTSKEIGRAVRNMSGLKVRREKTADGKTQRNDQARELARGVANQRELVVETLSRMELHRRDRRMV